MIHIIISILLIGFLIFIHELGHYSIARFYKVYVKEFAIGFPPRVLEKVRKGTKYSLGLIPFGGFVRLLGEDESEVGAVDIHGKNFQSIAWFKRIPILLGGILFNIIFAWIGFYIILVQGNFKIFGDIPLYIKEYTTTGKHATVLYVEKDSLAEKSGLLLGDEILDISMVANNGSKKTILNPKLTDIKSMVSRAPDTLLLGVYHKSTGKDDTIIFNSNELHSHREKLGIAVDYESTIKVPYFAGIIVSLRYTLTQFGTLFSGVAQFFIGLFSFQTGLEGVSGPLGIVTTSASFVKEGFLSILYFISFLSINLAALNLLPLPGLDGYHVLITTAEGVSKRKIPQSLKSIVMVFGMVFILGLSLVVTYFDIIHIAK